MADVLIENLASFAAVVSALIAGGFALWGHQTAKKSAESATKVSRDNAQLAAEIARRNAILSAELEIAKTMTASRQEWINVLREDMAEFAGISARRSRVIASGEVLGAEEFERMVVLSARIQMRLNPKDDHFEDLLDSISSCSLEKDAGKHGRATKDFVQVSQKILKKEWEVLKNELKNLKNLDDKVRSSTNLPVVDDFLENESRLSTD